MTVRIATGGCEACSRRNGPSSAASRNKRREARWRIAQSRAIEMATTPSGFPTSPAHLVNSRICAACVPKIVRPALRKYLARDSGDYSPQGARCSRIPPPKGGPTSVNHPRRQAELENIHYRVLAGAGCVGGKAGQDRDRSTVSSYHHAIAVGHGTNGLVLQNSCAKGTIEGRPSIVTQYCKFND
jgi:hypothetical protein